MRAIYILLVVLFLVPFASSAAVKTNKSDVRNYKTELKLTQQQISQLDVIYSNLQAKMKLMAPSENKEKGMEQKRALRKEMRTQVMKVLTPEQRKSYSQLMGAQKVKPKTK